MLHLVAERYESPSERIDASKEMEKPHKFHLEFELLMFMDRVRKSGKDLRSEIHKFQCDMNNMTDLMREMLRIAGLDVPPSDQLNFKAAVTDDFDSSSKTQCSKTTAAIHGALKVSEIVYSQEMSALEDGVRVESTIEDSVHVDDAQHFDFTDSNEILSRASTVKHIINEENKQAVEISCVVLGKMVDPTNACNVFDEMHEPIPEENLVSIEVTKDAHYLLDKMPTLYPVNTDEGLNGNKRSLSLYPYIVETGRRVNRSSWISSLITNISKVNVQELSHMDDVLRVSETNSPPLSKQGFNFHVFDPGTLILFKHEDYESQTNENTDHLPCVSIVPFHVDFSHVSKYVDIVACNLLDNMSKGYSSKEKVGVKGLGQPTSGNWELHVVDVTGELSFNDDDTNFVSAISSSKMMFGETSVFMFDPGIGSLHLTGYAPLNYREMLDSSVVALRNSKVIFCFNLDGCCLSDCVHSEFSMDLAIDLEVNGAIYEVSNEIYSTIASSNMGVSGVVVLPLKIGSALLNIRANEYSVISFGDILGRDGLFWRPGSSFEVYSVDLRSCPGIWLCLLPLLRANFSWDPGICTIFANILEDKDDFKWVGKCIILMEHITELTIAVPILMNHGEDHLGAIALQLSGDMAYDFSLQASYPRYLIVNSPKGLHSLMIYIFNTREVSVNFKWSFHHRFALSLFQGYHMRKLKESGMAMRILRFFALYRHSQYSLWSKLGWWGTSIVLSSWCTVEYIALEVNRSAHHILSEDIWKVCPNVAPLLGLVTSIVTQFPLYNVLISSAAIMFNANKYVWMEINGENSALGDKVLIHLVGFTGSDYNIQNFVVGIMVKSWSNSCNSASLLDGGMNTFGNVFAIIYHPFEIHFAAVVKSTVLIRSEREIQYCPSFGLQNFIWDPALGMSLDSRKTLNFASAVSWETSDRILYGTPMFVISPPRGQGVC